MVPLECHARGDRLVPFECHARGDRLVPEFQCSAVHSHQTAATELTACPGGVQLKTSHMQQKMFH